MVVFAFDRDPRFQHRLEPGQTWRDGWRYPIDPSDARRVRVEADDMTGTRVFCAYFTYQYLSRSGGWRIQIELDRLSCGD